MQPDDMIELTIPSGTEVESHTFDALQVTVNLDRTEEGYPRVRFIDDAGKWGEKHVDAMCMSLDQCSFAICRNDDENEDFTIMLTVKGVGEGNIFMSATDKDQFVFLFLPSRFMWRESTKKGVPEDTPFTSDPPRTERITPSRSG